MYNAFHIKTVDLVKTAKELARDHNAQYAEDCVRAVLRERMISVDQFYCAMRALYSA